LHVHPSVSEVYEKVKNINLGSLGDLSLPFASSHINETDSVVRLKNGEIVAIGGLMKQKTKNYNSGLPGMSKKNPLTNRNVINEKSELVILIRPTVINDNETLVIE